MRFILSFVLISTFGFAMQTCEKSKSTASKANVAKTETSSTTTANTNTPATTTAAHPDDNAARITLEEAKKAYDSGNAIIVDSRPEDAYKLEHIKGSINVPLADFEASYKKIPTDKKIIVYCS